VDLRFIAAMCCAAAFIAAAPLEAGADEGGVPFWFSGQYASLSAIPPQPGWTLTLLPYFYDGSASKSISFERGGGLSASLNSTAALMIIQPSNAPNISILGGQPSIGLGFGFGGNWTSAKVSLFSANFGNIGVQHSDSVGGALDLYP
jgi:hypothetical protein